MRAEWAFKIFDSDGDQLLGENDIRFFSSFNNLPSHGVFNIQERGRCNHRDRRDCLQKPWWRGAQHGGQERPQVSKSQFWALPRKKTCLGLSWEKNLRTVSSRLLQGNRPQPNWTDFPCRVQANGGQVVKALQTNCCNNVWSQFCRVEMCHVWKNLILIQLPIQVPRLRQQLQNQDLNDWNAKLPILTRLSIHEWTTNVIKLALFSCLSSTSTLKVQRLPERPQSEACSRIPKQILGENWRQLR